MPRSIVAAFWWECACAGEKQQLELNAVPLHFYISYCLDHNKEVPGTISAIAAEMDYLVILGKPN